ncbi:alpha/beta-hydrolase [Lindgomyces ingoldianus]|uniref:Alpha/beta-hydrolase n=1 Tax=Lindgomyces ingoldianus TaxID=673940 RepID=A0ACB6RGN3_9PLEO|nr:alpha/beta-hydrolase [Lindgomyces ingoldianus]KAF2477621.1 alpha/beta-hydrolase [Lindgomyces ingoldianus]
MFFFAIAIALFGVNAGRVRCDPVSDALSAIPTATISDGKIVGTTTNIAGPTGLIAVNKFLGIPFASPPTDSARFTPPKPPVKWSSKDTKEFKPACIQVFAPVANRTFVEEVFNNPPPAAGENEDCLYLNVFAPKKKWDSSKPPYPVMYWMYGGGWKFGASSLQLYDGAHFAALEDIIIVTVNYRTNAFGLPQAPTIKNVTERNLALLDQRAGLAWVQSNIDQFGGDKSRVTIFGESAGSVATDILVTSYPKGSKPPFSSAIMESGSYAYLPLANCNNSDFTIWNGLVDALGCTNTNPDAAFACVKGKPAADIKNAQELYPAITFGFACDNYTFVSDPRSRMEVGNVAQVPVLMGSNTQDGSFYANFYANYSFDIYWGGTFGFATPAIVAQYQKVKDAYPIGSEGRVDLVTQLTQIATDWNFHCPALLNAATSSKYIDTYRYLFNASFPNTRINDPTRWPEKYQGAYHSSEIQIVFNTAPSAGATPEEQKLSETMRKAWAAFARNPNQAPITGWTKSGSDGLDAMMFGKGSPGDSGMVKDSNKCDVWKQFIIDLHA